MEKNLPALLATQLATFADTRRFVVAYSGGADSHALLHALKSLCLPQETLALHVNHGGFSVHDDSWQAHCAATCAALGVAFYAERVQVLPDGKGPENAARQARYDAFASCVGAGDVLLLAHHADDQMETFFLRLLRGAGVRGLSGMPQKRAIGGGQMLRPWLTVSRDAVRRYAVMHSLRWAEDESNHTLCFDRNYLRMQVLPLLQKRWPQAEGSLARSMHWCLEADALADELAEMDYAACCPQAERLGFSLVFSSLAALSRARARNVLRLWLTRCGAPMPSHRLLDAMLEQGLGARMDAAPQQRWLGWQCARYRCRGYLFPQWPDLDLQAVWLCVIDDSISDRAFGRLSFTAVRGLGMRVDTSRPLTIRFVREGVRCRPQGRVHSQTLKKLFQEYAVPPWLRERVPLIYQGDKLLAVGDFWVCAEAAADEAETGYLPQWALEYRP